MLGKIMDCYGSRIILSQDGSAEIVRGFLQPGGEKTATTSHSPVGDVPLGSFTYIGMEQVHEGDTLTLNGEAYRVRQAAAVQGNDGPLYYWALCVRKGGADLWGL